MGELDDIRKNRFIIGLSASIIFHIVVFIVFQYIISFNFEKPKEFRGAITITLQNVIPEEGMKKQTNLQKKEVKTTNIKNQNIKRKEQKTVTNKQISVKQTVQKSTLIEKPPQTRSKLEQTAGIKPSSIEKPKKQVMNYSESTEGEVTSKLQKGEVKTLSKNESNVPVIPQGIKEKKKEEKPLPFKPGVKVEEEPLAFNVGELTKKNKGKPPESGSEPSENIITPAKTTSIEQAVKSNSMIEWERGSQVRKVISMGPKPKLPNWVKKEGLRLNITLVFKVTPDGYVTDVQVLRSSGYSDVDAAVMESVRKIIFEPVSGKKSDTAKITYLIEPK